MGSNRTIKSDGNIEIESTSTTASGNLTVNGQATLTGISYPISDGSPDQVLKTNGAGVLSFTTVSAGGGGVDTVASAAEAAAYSGTEKIINITASEAVVFTSALSDRVIINENDYEVKFQADVTNCIIQSDNNIEIENNSSDGSADVSLKHSKIKCLGLEFNASGDTSGNDITIRGCEIACDGGVTLASVSSSSSEYIFQQNNVYCGGDFSNGSATVAVKIEKSNLSVHRIDGAITLDSTDGETTIDARKGSASNTNLTIQGDQFISGTYAHPFVANYTGVNTKIISQSHNSSQQACSGNDNIVVFGDTSSSTYIDNTSSLDSDGKFTAPVKGMYHIRATIYVSSAGTSFPTNVVNSANLLVESTVVQAVRPAEMQWSASECIFHLDCVVSLSVGHDVEVELDGTDTSYTIAYTSATAPRSTFSVSKIN